MSKRQTLSERFDNLGAPKYDDMIADESHVDTLDEEDNDQLDGTTFTVVNREARLRETRNQRITQVIGAKAPVMITSPNVKYIANRTTANRQFRRELNPSPYFSSQSRPPFRTNRAGGNVMYKASRANNFDNHSFLSDPNEVNGNNYRGLVRNPQQIGQWRGFGMNSGVRARTSTRGAKMGMRGALRGHVAARNGFDGKSNNRRGGRITGNGNGNGNGRGRGRGNLNNSKNNITGRGLTEKQLDKELEQYYVHNDPQKLKDMKNDQLDREMDEYWMAPDQNNHNGTKSDGLDGSHADNGGNTQKHKSNIHANENSSKKGTTSGDANDNEFASKDF